MPINEHFILKDECLLFFQANPFTIDTLKGIAMRLGRKPEHIGHIIDYFVRISILCRMGEGEHAIYRYRQPDVTHRVERL